MAKYQQYESVLLKDGRIATIVEVYEPGAYDAEAWTAGGVAAGQGWNHQGADGIPQETEYCSHALNGGREELNGADRRNPAGSFFICKVR